MVLCTALPLEKQASRERPSKNYKILFSSKFFYQNTCHNHSPLLPAKNSVSWEHRKAYKLREVCRMRMTYTNQLVNNFNLLTNDIVKKTIAFFIYSATHSQAGFKY